MRERASAGRTSWMTGANGAARRLLDGFALLSPAAPLDLRLLGRVLLHAAVVGVLAGAIGALFFAALELGQRILLEGVAGFSPLRAAGETFLDSGSPAVFRPWALAVLPALGGLASGLITARFAPEAAGGGGDATIEAYHRGGLMRGRVIPVKTAAAVLALSSGASGGREGPTMQLGAAIGSLVARILPTSRRERRVLFVAGIAAGISAVFRTPLGAALLATEMLYRDDFESDALVPAILASVISYSVVITAFGETTLFAIGTRFPFVPRHLPLYAGAAIVLSLAGAVFVAMMRAVHRGATALPGPAWARPAVGGLLMGILGMVVVEWMGSSYGAVSRGFSVLGGGYGVAQVVLDGAPWLPWGWGLVGLLLLLAFAKMAATALSVGSGAAVGDFAPSLLIGALLGGAFGHAARILLGDPRIEPAAYALVGMGTFYAGVAHTPLAAVVLVSELAGSYDLLVPMMLSVGIATFALRRWSLYPAQPAGRWAARARRDIDDERILAALATVPVLDLACTPELPDFAEGATLQSVAAAAIAATRQRVVVVRSGDGRPRGLLDLSLLSEVSVADLRWARATDAAVPFAFLSPSATWREAAEMLELRGLAQVPIVSDDAVIGWIGERELARAHGGAARAPGEAAPE